MSISLIVLLSIGIYSLLRMAAPADEAERRRSDEDQVEFIRQYMAKRNSK